LQGEIGGTWRGREEERVRCGGRTGGGIREGIWVDVDVDVDHVLTVEKTFTGALGGITAPAVCLSLYSVLFYLT
jgi:hypothetical protein